MREAEMLPVEEDLPARRTTPRSRGHQANPKEKVRKNRYDDVVMRPMPVRPLGHCVLSYTNGAIVTGTGRLLLANRCSGCEH